jgi:predicted nucleic acid-binding protein
MKVLLDTNIILDIALERQPFEVSAAKILEASDFNQFHLFITASMATDIFYLARKARGRDAAIAFLKDLLDLVDVCAVDKTIILEALQSGFPDFEDAVQNSAAQKAKIDVIVTRNKDDFAKSQITIYHPDQFVLLHLSIT